MTSPLPQNPLGNTGLFTASLGLGTVKWGRNEGLKHGPFALPDDRTCLQLLDLATQSGVTLLDTAPAYGISQERLGRFLQGRRDQFLLFSKVGESFADGVSGWDFNGNAIRRQVEESLKKLRTDYLDGLLLHCPRVDLPVIGESEGIPVLQELKQEGKVRCIGASTMSLEGGLAAIPLCDVIMVAWNTGFTEQQAVVEAAAVAGKGILLKKVLSSGDLTGPAPPGGLAPAAWRLRAAMALPGHPVVIAGTIQPQHLLLNLDAAAQGPWPPSHHE